MRGVFRLLLATAAAVSVGFIWTVGQAGLAQTNRNLCDLWAALPLPPYKACEFQNALVYIALIAAALLLIWGAAEIVLSILRRRKKRDGDAPVSAPPPEAAPSYIELNYGEESPFERITSASHLYRLERVLSLEFKNTHPHTTLQNCKLEIVSIEPFMGTRRPFILRDSFTLAGGDHVFIPFVRYGESRTVDRSVVGDSAIAVCAPEGANPNFLAALPHDIENIITIRGTAIGSTYCEERIVVWVGAGTRLRIRKYESTTGQPAYISLEDATREAYGAARNTDIGQSAELMNTNGLLAWFAWYYHTQEIPVYGNVRNSTRVEPVLFRNTDVKMENGRLIAKEIYGSLIWENMQVRKTDHARLLGIIQDHARTLKHD
jgi:hypothetical protein